MKRKDVITLALVGLMAGIISLAVSGAIFDSAGKRSAKAPVVEPINSTLPDLKNDSNYNSFLNPNALNPTQPVQIGNTQNSAPFNSQ